MQKTLVGLFVLSIVLCVESNQGIQSATVTGALESPALVAEFEPRLLLPFVIEPAIVPPIEMGPGFGVSPDFKKQPIPKMIAPNRERAALPNVDPLFKQIFRHAELKSSADKILPWVYATTTELVVAEFESALTNIDQAGKDLDQAMYNALFDDSSLDIDPILAHAAIELDNAEFTILMLVELAKLEL